MSKRRISAVRRQSRLRRSSSGPGELEEDSNVFGKEDPFWYKRMEKNNTALRPSLRLSIAAESSAVLDSESDEDMPPPQDRWWNPLRKYNQTINRTSEVQRTIRSSLNADPTSDITIHDGSMDSLPERDPRKRKTRLFLDTQKRESLGARAFMNVLNESSTTVFSDPGPSKRKKSVPNTLFLSDEDSFIQTKNPNTRKTRAKLFNKIRASQSESATNVFNNLLDDASVNSESSTPAINKSQQARTLNESQKSEVQITREIGPNPDSVSQKIISGDIEPNASHNRSKKEGTENRKENSTFDGNLAGGEPIQELVSLEKHHEEKQNKANLSKSQSSRLTHFKDTKNLENKPKEGEDLSRSSSELDVEYKNLGSTKSSKKSLELSSKNRKSHQPSQTSSQNNSEKIFHKIPVTSFSRSEQTAEIFDSEEKKDLISFGTRGIVDQNNHSKNHNSSLNKSRSSSQNLDNSRQSSRLDDSVKVPDRLSIFAEQPKYESTRKIDVPKSIKNQRSGELTFDQKEASNAVLDPKILISTEDNRKESGDFANTQNPREREGSIDSERSHTISLSEDGSIESVIQYNDTSQNTNQNIKSISNKRYGTSFIPADSSSDKEALEENNSSKRKTAKPVITDYEILKVNDIDIRKLKGFREISKENKTSYHISRSQSAIRDVSIPSVEKSSILTKDSQMSVLEDKFSRLHGQAISEIASTSREDSQISRRLFNKESDNDRTRETLNHQSSSDLRKILEDDEGNETEVGENPLLVHTGTGKDLERKNPEKDLRDQKQKMIDDYFRRRGVEKTEVESQLQRIPFAAAAGNKSLMANHKKQLEAIVAPIKRELLKRPREQEKPEKKVLIAKGISKKKQSKFVDPAYLVNGLPYKPPNLPKPKHWATDHLYKFIWKKIEPKYQGKKRVRSEKFVLKLTQAFNKIMKKNLYKNYVDDLESLMEEMARLGLIVNRKDFNDFCNEFMPYDFRIKTTPILLPGNIMSIPYDKEKFYAPILSDDDSSLGG
ncbi:titin homolog isoform X2 [Belonocnema kinseyi]|uniref:titin homolog isoform X2 n=1 Tax=Belonocnema kinseyi TaxID=2817044 RepID=UPI00143D6341|nr:titin homolog isoform X2 [Belonocnema kinseyi]